ncbi:MAG TPA: PAS domain S-box protein [Desulfuromonadaceae bacterium]|jgi:PAS domain S-box-containing protein
MLVKKSSATHLLFALVVSLLLLGHINSQAAQDPSPLVSKNILILNSYNQTFAWTDQEMDGIIEVLHAEDINYMPSVEYLDWKRFPDNKLAARTLEYLRLKYRGQKIDAVIVTDNVAMEFALKNRNILFPKAAIIFCGINGYSDAMIAGHERVSGVVEDVDPAGTLRLIQALMPDTREIVALFEDSESARLVRKALDDAVKNYKGQIKLRVLTGLNNDQLIREIRAVKPGSVILQGPYYSDREGHSFNAENVIARILPYSSVPIFSLWDFLAGKGITGGSLLSGKLQGRNAALIALRFLRGESVVPVMKDVPMRILLDHQQLKRFGLDQRPLPKNIELINRQFSFIETYFSQVMTVGAVFVILLTIIAALVFNVRRRLQVEATLRASEESLATTFSSIGDAAIATDEKGRVVRMNRVAEQFTGWLEEEAKGRPLDEIFRIINEYTRAPVENPVDKVLATGLIVGLANHTALIARDGSEMPIADSGAPIVDRKTGAVTGVVLVFRDVSAERAAEEALKSSEQLLRSVIDSAPFGAHRFELDAEDRLIFTGANAMADKVLGLDHSRLCGKEIVEAFPKLKETLIPFKFKEVAHSGERYETELFEYAYEHITVAYEISAVQIGEQRMVAFFRDVTEKRKAEEALRQSEKKFSKAFHTNPTWMTISTLDTGCYLDANETFLRECGYTREEVIGHTSTELGIWPDEKERFAIMETIRLGGVIRNHEVKRRTKDGRILTVLWSADLMELDGEQSIISASLNITDRIRLETESIKAQKLESLGILAGGIAHDFNNLLTGILGNVSLAKQLIVDNEKAIKRLEACELASLRAGDLTNQLLTFARGGEPVKKITMLPRLIMDSANFALRGSNVRCSFNFPQDIWQVEVDEGQFSQVINNLVINADQAMPEGGEIVITAANVVIQAQDGLPLEEGPYVRIMVKDQGSGIDPAIITRLFDPYFTTKSKGSGLGLASVYSIVNRHNGYVTVDSHPGEGATFAMYLLATVALNRVIEEIKTAELSIRLSGKVLVMDDEEIIRDVATEILSHFGFDVTVCDEGNEAFELYKSAHEKNIPFDLVILDLTVPGAMGGKQAIKKLLEFNPGVKAIVSSGYSNDPIIANFSEFGFSAAVAKPFRQNDLYSAICNVLV